MMMKNYDQSVEKNHNPKLPYNPDHSYRTLIMVVQDQEKLRCFWT